jgi:RNA polymerase sigma factor (sigma-70 family)
MEARQLRKRRRAQLEPHVLRGAELALKHKLRRKFSADFTTRYADELIAKAAKEYVVAEARGERIENPGGFLVDVAYKRAIDALRKESNDPELDELEAASSLPDPSVADPSEELERDEVRSQVYEAIAHLEGEERQVIALVYFEGMSGREAAGPLGISQSSSLRRLRSASAKLREWLPAIEQGSFCTEAAPQLRALAAGTAEGLEETQAKLHLENCAACRETMARREAFGFEVGLAAWLSLSGAASAQAHLLGDRLAGLCEAARDAVTAAIDRARELALRLTGSGGAEAAGGAGSAALGKAAAGACATAAAVCAVTGVIGPGIGGVDLSGGGHEAAAPKARSASASRTPVPAPASPAERTPIVASPPTEKHERAKHAQSSGSASQSSTRTARATTAATEQFGVESAASSPPAESSPPPPPPEATSSGSSKATPTQVANEQFGP